MNYFQQQDLPSTSYRRYDPSSHPLHPPITDSYRAYTDQRPPGTGSLHPTNPFYGGASLSFPSGDPSAAARPNEAGTFAALEREKQAALARAQEMQHKIDEGRRSAAPFAHSHSYHRGEDTTQRDQLSYTEHKVLDLEQRLTSQNKTFEAIMKERDQLDTLSTSLQGTLEEEKKRRSDLELQVESSKKGQSISAKQVKHLEEKLKEVEERDRALQEGKDRFEKRVKDLEEDKSQLKKQVEAATSKYNNAYREKEGIIVKLRGREHDNSKMSDKLNLMRRENQALQSVIEELKEDLHTLKEEIKKGSPDEYKRVKEELRRERSTSDRLRSERNELREGFQELRRSYERHLSLVSTLRFNSRLREREHESGNEAKQSRMGLQVQEAEYDKNRYKTELLEPKPTSADQHRPKFSLNANDYLKTDLNDDGSGGGGGGVVEVITDEDGLEYQGRHMKMDDEERPVEKNTSQRLSTSLQITNNGKAREEKEKEKESGALLAFTMDSIPLQPVKMDTPLSKEEISLFSPAPPTASVPELREGVRSKQAEEDSRKRWLEGYAQASGLKVKDERDHGDVKTQLDSSSRPTLKMLGNGEPAQINKDPFAELDPLL
uniref:Uncharacterized protein n=1 Tax=Kwoniella dejecticola CBS 10117 TaxID=1296121 RepID=A0A1A6A4M3_9TREE|nr:uncharacterized protein I303_04338 [Kwoniella dejecticola CBS 10117]OBR85011.1 hypothetical protein I303_04338 [Kwoniella dejecticola CBS 10117]